MRITAEWLEEQEACPDQVALFRTTFGEAAEVSPETLARAREVGLSLAWLADEVLTDAARAEYERVITPAWEEYVREWMKSARYSASAWAEYDRFRAPEAARLLADPANWEPTSTEGQT